MCLDSTSTAAFRISRVFSFFVQPAIVDKSTVYSASMHWSQVSQITLFSNIFIKMGPIALFTHLKIILLQCFQFQFSVSAKIMCIQTDPFLSILNLSFNQLVGLIPYIKLFGTFLEASYERNKGLCGRLLKITASNIWRYSLILRAFDWLELPKCRARICIWLWDNHCAAYILEEVETGEYNISNTLIIFFFKIFPRLYLENMRS